MPLDEVASVVRRVGPLSVNHFGQIPAATISFNLRPGFSLGEAAQRINEVVRELRMPASMTTSFQGTVKEFQKSFENLTVLLVVAILVIYIVLGVLYESFIHPITILSGLPSAVFGALADAGPLPQGTRSVRLRRLDHAIRRRQEERDHDDRLRNRSAAVDGKSPAEAIYQGCMLRFRPIMMTTMAALFGTLPIALGYGEGADARQPLGLAVVGGLLVSQFLTLYITPVMYLYLEQLQVWLRRSKTAPQQELPVEVVNLGSR